MAGSGGGASLDGAAINSLGLSSAAISGCRGSSGLVVEVGSGPGLDAVRQRVVPSRVGASRNFAHDRGAGSGIHDIVVPGGRDGCCQNSHDGAGYIREIVVIITVVIITVGVGGLSA